MGAGVFFAEALDGDVGVDLGGGQVGVAQKFLHAPEVGAVVQKVGGEGVPQCVRGGAEGEARGGEPLFQEFFDGDAGKGLPRAVDEEGRGGGMQGKGGQPAVAEGKGAPEGFGGGASDGAKALFFAFSDSFFRRSSLYGAVSRMDTLPFSISTDRKCSKSFTS